MTRTLAAKVIEGLRDQGWEIIGYGGTWTGAMRPLARYIQRRIDRAVAAEREACAKVCADYTAWGREWGQDNNHMAAEAATNECAAAIRARGKK